MANYVDASKLRDEICEYKKTGIMSDQLGIYLMKMCEGIGSKYQSSDDAISECVLKSVKALSYIDCRRKPSWIFNYLTSTIFNHFRRMYVENAKHLNYFEKYVRLEYGIDINDIYWDSI